MGFEAIRIRFDVEAPGATPEQLASLLAKTERYCTVLQTLQTPPDIRNRLNIRRPFLFPVSVPF